MLSRVAKNIYWIARYLERAENTARLVNVNIHLFMDLPSTSRTFGWESLITIMGSNRLFYELYSEPTEDNVINFLLGDTRNLGSIHSALAQARENMRTTRDIVPKEAWEQLNNLYLFVKNEVTNGITKRNRYEFLKQVILGCQQITGIASGTMSRDAAYHFFRLGNYLERADMTTRIVDVRSANLLPKPSEDTTNLSPFDNVQWMSVLKSLTAYQMYRQHVRLRVKGADVLRFLLQDTEFPRSVFFCLGMVENYLSGLPKNDTSLRAIARLQRQVQGANVRDLAYQGLHKFMDDLQIGFGTVYEHIATNYFGEAILQVRQSQSQSMG